MEKLQRKEGEGSNLKRQVRKLDGKTTEERGKRIKSEEITEEDRWKNYRGKRETD